MPTHCNSIFSELLCKFLTKEANERRTSAVATCFSDYLVNCFVFDIKVLLSLPRKVGRLYSQKKVHLSDDIDDISKLQPKASLTFEFI